MHPRSYLIVAGLVFTPCSEPYLRSEYGEEFGTESPVKLLHKMYHEQPRSPDQQLVLLSQVLACEANLGYEDLYNTEASRVWLPLLVPLASVQTSCFSLLLRSRRSTAPRFATSTSWRRW